MRNLCFASRVSEIRLERLSSLRGAAIKGLSRKDRIPLVSLGGELQGTRTLRYSLIICLALIFTIFPAGVFYI